MSFAKPVEALAKASAVKSNSDGTYTFNDKNGVLANFDAAVTDGSVVSKSGNTLKIKADSGKTAIVKLTQKNVAASGELTGFLTLTSSSKQTLAELKADPRKYYAAVKGVETGTLNIVKTSEDGIVANIAFTVVGNGKTYNVKTDSKGKISISDLTPGTYTVTEVVPVRYKNQQSQKVTVQAGKTATVSFANTLKTGSIKINKQSEDGENGGRTFVISGGGKSYTITTGNDGIAILNNIPVYDKNNVKIAYTISEKNVPIKYVVPADHKVSLTADATTNVTFKNVLKKFTAEIVKKDSETGISQGDATLAGAVYGIYLDDDLVDTYTTDENGYFKTKEYVCGNYTIQELSPSEGYLLDETSYPVGAEAKNYTIEHNPISMTVTEDSVKGKISIIKHSDDDENEVVNLEKGAEFEVYLKSAGSYANAKGSEKDYLITDENGFAETKLMPYGVYTVHQTKTVNDAAFVSDFDVFIAENGKTYEYILNNAPFKSYIHITKLDAETGKNIAYEGAGFQIYDSNGSLVNMGVDTFYTNSEGYLITPEMLHYSDYTLVEVQAPMGYVLDSEPVAFSVTAANSEIENAVNIVKVQKSDVAQKGKISVQKTGDIFSSVTALGSAISIDENGETHESGQTTYIPVFEENGLANAVYQVIASEDIVTADGTVRASAGDIVAELTTDENGYAETDLLYLGKYEVKEIQAPYGYVLNSELQLVELVYAGQEVTVRDTVNAAFVNDYQGVEISLEKVMENDELFGISAENCYSNVRFGLFAAEEIVAADGSSIPENGLIAEVSLDENMKAVIAEKVPFAKYYVQEIATDEHYILNGEKYLVSFEYQGQEMTTVYVDCGQFKNLLKRGTVKGIKVNEADEPLENALFGLFPADCEEFTADNAIMTSESDSKGEFGFEEVPFGSYIVREIAAPTGYVLSDESYPVTVSENEETINIRTVNESIDVEISKLDVYGKELSGAKMQLVDIDGNVVDEWVSDGTNHVVTKLPAGGYTLKETAAPDGYIIATDIRFEVDIYGNVTVENIDSAAVSEDGNPLIVMIDDTTKVQISKQDITTGEELPGAKLQVIDKDGNIVEEWTSSNEPHFIEAVLKAGESYVLHEITAPDGYEIAADVEFTVNADGTVTEVVMKDEHNPTTFRTPYTGDNHSNLLAWIMIGLSLAIGSVLFICRKKKMSMKGVQNEE